MLREGYEVLDIRSDDRAIEAMLRSPNGLTTVVVLNRGDAARILYDDERHPQRPAPGPRRPSRFLVTTPLR